MTYRHLATVTSRSDFPIDMLRYDRCHPLTEMDSNAIRASLAAHEGVVVVVERVSNSKDPNWTIARWASFGATLVPSETKKML